VQKNKHLLATDLSALHKLNKAHKERVTKYETRLQPLHVVDVDDSCGLAVDKL